MNCEICETHLLDYLENQLPPARHAAVAGHLAVCAYCDRFARELQRLDAALGEQIRIPALPADFDRRLRARIQAATPAWSATQHAERLRQLQGEFEAGMARIHRGAFAPGRVWSQLSRPLLAALAGGLAWWGTMPWTARLHTLPLGASAGLLPWLVASAVFLAVGVAQGTAKPAVKLVFFPPARHL